MPDTDNPTTPPQAGTTETPPAAGTGDGTGPEPKTFDADYVKTLRDEAAKHRKEASETKAKLKEFEDAKLSETERLKKQAEEAQAAAQTASDKATQRITRAVAIAEASKLGFADPSDAIALVDLSKVERDDDGEPTNLDKLLGDLAKAKPYLLAETRAAAPQVGATNPARSRTSATGFTRTQLRDPVFFAANRAAVFKAMSEGRISDE